ncbi:MULTISPECIES: endonuclease VII domain-containing protein [Nocardia]|uniref:endonuclease VII domain-containing protein n=1 Tax=Nocardia TaxID=1817 RepID=UPI001895BD1B|nr:MULTISPECIES: endonuclease VII domain-containing protein [Nocardia]MBF6411047.1 endonuclease VII domain-containing protein [Nocardia farcinica]
MTDCIEKACAYCATPFQTPNDGNGRRRLYCSVNCGKRASFRKLNGPAKRGSVARCRWCDEEFIRDSGKHTLCSQRCRGAVARHKVGGQRWYHAKSRYGLTREQIEQMFRDQDGRCAICDTALLGRGLERTSPQIDHCHATGKPRALLCRLCNTALGNFRDDPELIGRALAYVNRWAATE